MNIKYENSIAKITLIIAKIIKNLDSFDNFFPFSSGRYSILLIIKMDTKNVEINRRSTMIFPSWKYEFKIINDAIIPAAAGIGNPIKGCFFEVILFLRVNLTKRYPQQKT